MTLAIGADGTLSGGVGEAGVDEQFPIEGHAVSGGPGG